ncbi:WD40-repeat-containing domain protein [Aspergillus flavus]|uniref:WD40-repeat-containing domain protein n=1 Tax=Aspergillus flavus (strain ATCC 200026 / FGSC A1120 / IAM 13836 / NRRL 3357 / JCM 12722 / SRRC 167) TaxID=332952 RepID=A0A7U2R312_ASPFN|nr:WD40-repeat-containing domain protein [Aspergillus flavus]
MGYMNQPKFMELYAYALESDFQIPDGESAAWAPGHPFHWGQELDKIILGGVGSSLSLSPDDQFLAVGVGQNIHVYSTFTREYVETLTGHLDEVSRVFFASRMIGCGLYTLVSSAEGSIVIWELDRDGKNVSAEKENKKMVYVTQNNTAQNEMRDAETLPCVNIRNIEAKENRYRLLGHTDTIMWVATSPNSTLVASISWDGTARIWDADDGDCLQVLGPFGGQMCQGSPKAVVYVYDIEKAEEVLHFEGCEHWARSLDWSPDGKLLAVGASDSSVRVLDPYTGEEKIGWRLKFDNRLMRRFAGIQGVKFIDAGRKLMFRSTVGFTEVYDLQLTKQQFARGPELSDADGAVRFWRHCE